jgi:4-amino-4-deoxy-L-arabinose transferase-like glycosyltransferase
MRRERLALCAILVLGAVLRGWGLGTFGFNADEAGEAVVSRGTFRETLERPRGWSMDPPFFRICLYAAQRVVESDVGLRAINVAAGVLTIAMTYWMGRWVTGQAVHGLVAAFFLSVSSAHIHHSRELRTYAFFVLFSVAMVWAFERWLASRSVRRLGLLLAVVALAASTNYGTFWTWLSIQGVVLLLRLKGDRRVLRPWFWGHLLLLPLLVWLGTSEIPHQIGRTQTQLGTSHLRGAFHLWNPHDLAAFTVSGTLALFSYLFFGYNNWDGTGVYFRMEMGGAFLVLVALGLDRIVRCSDRRDRLLVYLLFPLAGTFVASGLHLYPYGGWRQLLFMAPTAYLVVSHALVGFWEKRRWAALSLTTLAVLYGLYGHLAWYYRALPSEDLRPVLRELEGRIVPSQGVYVYYGAGAVFDFYWEGDRSRVVPGGNHRGNPKRYAEEAGRIVQKNGEAWIVFSHYLPYWEDERRLILEDLKGRYRLIDSIPGQGSDAFLFGKTSGPASSGGTS